MTLALALLLAAALVACGGGDGEDRAASPADAPATAQPVLGGPAAEFTAALGPPQPGTDPDQGQRFRPCGDVYQFVVFFDQDKAVEITRRSCTGTLAATNATTEAQSYFPAGVDPASSQPFTPFPAQGAARALQEGPATRYHSASLAADVRRVWFHDCNGRRVDPGTFALIVREDGWTLATGTCPNG